MDFIDELKKQLAYHEEQIMAIKIILDGQSKVYESSISKYNHTKNNNINDFIVLGIQNLSSDPFPISKSKRHQIIWLFENDLKKASRMPEIQNAYEKHSGNKDDITMSVRQLKGVPLIGTVKKTYDKDVNNKTFWGLSKWFSDDDFLSDFHPYS